MINRVNNYLDINNMIHCLNNIHLNIVYITYNHHHSLNNVSFHIIHMLMKIIHNMLHNFNNFEHRFDILYNVSFDMLHISYLHIGNLLGIISIDTLYCMFYILIDHILCIHHLIICKIKMDLKNNIHYIFLLYLWSFYIHLYLIYIDHLLNDIYLLKLNDNHLSIELDLLNYNIKS